MVQQSWEWAGDRTTKKTGKGNEGIILVLAVKRLIQGPDLPTTSKANNFLCD